MSEQSKGWMMALVAMIFWCGAAAQGPASRAMGHAPRPSEMQREQVCEAMAESLSLQGEVREQFLETYLHYQQEMEQIHREQFRPRPHHGADSLSRKRLSDEEIEAMLRKRFAVSRAILDVREKYFNAFLRFLTPRQIQQMYALEKRGAERMHAEHARRRPHAPSGRRE